MSTCGVRPLFYCVRGHAPSQLLEKVEELTLFVMAFSFYAVEWAATLDLYGHLTPYDTAVFSCRLCSLLLPKVLPLFYKSGVGSLFGRERERERESH